MEDAIRVDLPEPVAGVLLEVAQKQADRVVLLADAHAIDDALYRQLVHLLDAEQNEHREDAEQHQQHDAGEAAH